MELYVDTAVIAEIEEAAQWGVPRGCTTNPTLLAKAGHRDPEIAVREILAASLRHPMHVVEAARVGAHIATMPYPALQQLVRHPLTDIGLERFLADWRGLRETLAVPAGGSR